MQSAVLSILEGISTGNGVATATLDMLISAKSQLKKLLVSWNFLLPSFWSLSVIRIVPPFIVKLIFNYNSYFVVADKYAAEIVNFI